MVPILRAPPSDWVANARSRGWRLAPRGVPFAHSAHSLRSIRYLGKAQGANGESEGKAALAAGSPQGFTASHLWQLGPGGQAFSTEEVEQRELPPLPMMEMPLGFRVSGPFQRKGPIRKSNKIFHTSA